MKHLFNISKMGSELNNGVVDYFMMVDNDRIKMNDLLGSKVKITFTGEINCQSCGALTRKSFMQGYCYNCYLTAPETEECVLNPEKCKAHLGVARDIEYSKTHCLIPHYVYLSLTSDVKVGVTRNTQIPTRWIDQGAAKALIVAQTPNRYIAGLVEVFLKAHYNDKTNWKKMLLSDVDSSADLLSEKHKMAGLLPPVMKSLITEHCETVELSYPAISIPDNVQSVDLMRDTSFEGPLTAIKGQYLIVGHNAFNVRRHTGYKIYMEY